MKGLLCSVLLLLAIPSYAATTNLLIPSDLSALIFESDYGTLTLTVTDIISGPRWDKNGAPPISIATAIAAVTKQLPPPMGNSRVLSNISLDNYDDKGWYYLVVFEDYQTFSKDDLQYIVTNKYIAVVLMDGRVIAPTDKTESKRVEQGGPGYPPQGVGSPDP